MRSPIRVCTAVSPPPWRVRARRAAQEKLPYAEEVLVLRADVDERLQRIAELEHQVCSLSFSKLYWHHHQR